MDLEIEKRLEELLETIRRYMPADAEAAMTDPVIKMLLISLLHETRKIEDEVKNVPVKLLERYASDFIPKNKLNAMPAIAMVAPVFKSTARQDCYEPSFGDSYLFRTEETKETVTFVPLFKSMLFPFSNQVLVFPKDLEKHENATTPLKNVLWLGVQPEVQLHSLKGFIVMVRGKGIVAPEKIEVNGQELAFTTLDRFEDIGLLSPFDSYQSSGQLFSFMDEWRQDILFRRDMVLLYVTDPLVDRDQFKPGLPQSFKKNGLDENTYNKYIWLRLVFPEGYIIPEDVCITPNVQPVVNVEVSTVNLTPSAPIAKLQKKDNSFYLSVLRTPDGAECNDWDSPNADFLIRDYDASSYNNGDLHREVRNLYNHFVEDYYAFMEYNGIRDGEMIRSLRETIAKIGSGVELQNPKDRFDSGTYAVRNINNASAPSIIKVSFMTTMGRRGNEPVVGRVMENRKIMPFERNVPVVANASCGRDKASVDERYELVRYYSLTRDRLYTKRDIEAFVRKEIVAEFGKENVDRICVKIQVCGTAGYPAVHRGLYIDISFKDKMVYDQALSLSFGTLLHDHILYKSCLSMPLHVRLSCLEQ